MDNSTNPLSAEDSQAHNSAITENIDVAMEESNQANVGEPDDMQEQQAAAENDTDGSQLQSESTAEPANTAKNDLEAADDQMTRDTGRASLQEDHAMMEHDAQASPTEVEEEDTDMQHEQFHDAQERMQNDDTNMNVDDTTHSTHYYSTPKEDHDYDHQHQQQPQLQKQQLQQQQQQEAVRENDESSPEHKMSLQQHDESSQQHEESLQQHEESLQQHEESLQQQHEVSLQQQHEEPSQQHEGETVQVQEDSQSQHNPMEEESPAPFISAPASWQIPPSALQPKTETHGVEPVNKANLKRERLEQRIAKSEYDTNAWMTLINEVQQTGDLEATREVYERFLQVFPTSPRQWLAYLELELKYSNFNEVEALFTRCLKTVLSVDLWKFYLGYIRRINQGDSGTAATPEARAIIEKAYEYVLNNVGIDKDAGPIWADYIFFLKSAETTNTWEEQRKMDSMRRAYQKAVAIPLNNVEHLWKEYDQWENNLNRLTAKKFLGEKSSAYMTARTALREMRTLMENVNRGVIPKPPQWTEKEISQLSAWKQYIQWEKTNPLQLEDENMLVERISYAYQQAFLVLRFYPELWYDFAMYYMELQKPDKALAVLKQGVQVLPASLLLTFAYAELCESKRLLDDAKQAFDSLLERLDTEIDKLKASAQEEMDKIQQDADEERTNMNLNDDIDGEVREQLRSRERQVKKDQEEVENRLKDKTNALAKGCSLAWISYMRFARRTEGINAARALFSRARKANNRTYHVFIASALMEYHNSKDAVIAGKIFGLGHKLFADDPDYVSHYLDYLIQMKDDNNTRALFERTLATMPAEKAEQIWSKFLDYENKYGDLASIQNVEKRRNEALPSITMTQSFLERYSYLNIHSIDELELGTEVRQPKSADGKSVTAPAPTAVPAATAPTPADRGRSKDQNAKRPLLEPVHPERYPRPDLNQWQSFKPAEARRTAPSVAATSSGNRVPPAGDSANPPPPMAPTVPPPAIVKKEPGPPAVTPQGMGPASIQQQQPPASSNWNQGPPLPEAVAYFVSNLPPAQSFNGPLIQAGELVDLLRNIIIPLPPQGGPPSRGPVQQQKNMGGPPMPPGGRDLPPRGSGGYGGRGGGRGGGFKSRGGGGGRGRQGVKRRGGRDDYDDDYQQHKGMGPNRPPAYDVFRARQAKRHRDEPPY